MICLVASLPCITIATPGLVDALIQVSCRSLHPGDSVETTVDILRGQSIASRCLLNLSWESQNKIVLGQQAALVVCWQNYWCIDTHLCLSKSRTVREILIATRWCDWCMAQYGGKCEIQSTTSRTHSQVPSTEPMDDDVDGSVLRAKIVDSWYDDRGVNCLVRIAAGHLWGG
jgi:translation elongation factor EF-4